MEHVLSAPQHAYETLAEALRIFEEYREQPPVDAITDLQNAVAHATEAWQRYEGQRATQGKEFRYHVVKLKMLLAGAHHVREAIDDMHISKAA